MNHQVVDSSCPAKAIIYNLRDRARLSKKATFSKEAAFIDSGPQRSLKNPQLSDSDHH